MRLDQRWTQTKVYVLIMICNDFVIASATKRNNRVLQYSVTSIPILLSVLPCVWTLEVEMISEELRATIAKHDQSHILKYYDAGVLTDAEKTELETQVPQDPHPSLHS